MAALDRYIGSDSDDICCLIGKFLYLFLTGSPYVESYEVDNFVLRNGRTLAACAWRLYQAQVPEMSEIRAHYLLRTLVVDADPFKRIMEVSFLQTSHWERRLLAITHLFRVILDVINPSFNIEDRQWRSSVADVFFYFFSSQWADQSEEIRVAVETLSATLLPSHHQAISLCWNETLLKSPVSERLKLVTFLIQLHRHFPRWQVLAWDAIVESLMEERFDEDSPAAARLSVYGLPSTSDPDLAELRVSTMSLSLQMIADGIEIDSFRLLKIKNHLVEVVGFRDVLTAPTYNGQWFQVHFGELSDITDIALPCVNQFLAVMDASHTVEVSPSVMVGANDADERPVTILVGSIFIDAFLSIICMGKDLASLPIMTFKNLLETLCIVIYKHDFESPVLRHLQSRLRLAVTRSLDCLALDISYDVRQLALSVVQAYVKRWHSVMGSFIYGSIESIAKMVASQSQHHGQDALVVQAKAFLDTTLTRYAQNGLFANLLRRPMEQEFFFILKQVVDSNAKNNPQLPQSLRELLLRDVLTRAIEGDNTTFQNVLDNTLTYVAIVYHEGFTSEMMQFSGQQLIQFSRRAAEWGPDSINPDPLLKICAILLQHNKTFGRDILPSIDTVMRVLLSRLKVGVEGLSSLLQVTHTLHRKPTANDASTAHPILALLFEVLGDGLRLKARILPSTLNSIAEAITTTEYGGLPPIVKHLSLFLVLVDPAVHFLQNHSWQDVESDFKASLCIARIILQVSMQDLAIMRKLADYAEKTAHTNLKVRSWSILALAALLEKKEDWYSALFGQFSSFSYAYHSSIRGYTQGTSSFETAVVDLNYAYIAVKLWILLAYRVSGSGDVVKDSQAFRIWNELWPPFDSILKQFEVDPGGGLYSAIGTLVLSSVADLLVFMRTLHTPIALQASSHITTLNRLRQLTPGAIGNQKVNRALRSMSEAPPESSLETLIDQTAKDIMAAEKLRVLEAQAQAAQDRKAAERSRRDIRTVS
ncbi:hypothetical protein H0H92_010949 [Tricholoma furcatifolium]|nr:hypothetical protein H0H92_010949 [Tricholoma furcatifolium]